jgi:DNA repair exonuclease SbcCD ATPase subunit
MVSLDFKKGPDTYVINRGIKPDTFEIWQNGDLIPRPPHVRDYQKMLEEIIGMNFNTFVSLIHSNINSSNRILSMKKPEKRKFMEDVFGLSIYSQLNEKANSKIRDTREKLHEIHTVTSNNSAVITGTQVQNTEIQEKMSRLGSSKTALRDAEADLEDLLDKNPDIENQHNEIQEKMDIAKDDFTKNKDIIYKANEKFKMLNRWIRDINNNLNQLAESETTKKEYFEFIKENGDIHSIVDEIDILGIDIAKMDSDLMVLDGELKVKELELARLEAVQETMNDTELNMIECPECGTEIDLKKLQSKEIEIQSSSINVAKKQVEKTLRKKTILDKSIFDHKGHRHDLERKRDWLLKIQDQIRTDVDAEKEKKNKKRYQATNELLTNLAKKHTKHSIRIDAHIKLLSEERETLRLTKIQIDSQKNKISALKDKIKMEKSARQEFKAIIETNIKKIESLEEENRQHEKRTISLQRLIDYFEVIKTICKDENIKQYAISSIMPYLNKRTNHYLSEVGYGFYAVIDKWLDAQIKGPGVTKASYGSLSGGEGRGIDLAIQFGLLDIARIQAGIWPDLLIMDEILDSSVDNKGISKLMEIIKTKQSQENNKIFIISHREEIGESVDADFTYYVEKGRYSVVEVR